jgi:hypothetical protein
MSERRKAGSDASHGPEPSRVPAGWGVGRSPYRERSGGSAATSVERAARFVSVLRAEKVPVLTGTRDGREASNSESLTTACTKTSP